MPGKRLELEITKNLMIGQNASIHYLKRKNLFLNELNQIFPLSSKAAIKDFKEFHFTGV